MSTVFTESKDGKLSDHNSVYEWQKGFNKTLISITVAEKEVYIKVNKISRFLLKAWKSLIFLHNLIFCC